jgi:AbrB family looped-hinge helix DNA binding protein
MAIDRLSSPVASGDGIDSPAVPGRVKDEELNCCTNSMSIVTIKNKYQVVIPQRVREEIGLDVGDVLEARAEDGKIVFEPKSVVDRGIAESIAGFQAGKGYGPFDTHAAFVKALHKVPKQKAAKKKLPKRSAR